MGLDRADLWRLIDEAPEPVVPGLLRDAYTLELWREWCKGDRSPHGHPWFSSFHASSFPGEDPLACGRLAVYNLLDPPSEKPHSVKLQGWFDAGSDFEHRLVTRWRNYGVLLSADVMEDGVAVQTGFVDREHWLTGASDAIVLPPGTTKSSCVEIKTTSHEKVLAMLADGTVPKQHPKYLRQLGTYLSLAHEAPFSPQITICKKSGLIAKPVSNDPLSDCFCPARMTPDDRPHDLLHTGDCELERVDIQPPDDGTLIYSSREDPTGTIATFRLVYDPTFIAAGRKKLAEWRDAFERGVIPAHPHEGKRAKWSVAPCDWCPMKKSVCKPDYEQKIINLAESNLIASSRELRPGWDYEEKRSVVLDRWVNREEPDEHQ